MVLLCYLYHFVSFRFCSDVFFCFLFTKLHLLNLAFFQKKYSWFGSVFILIIYNPLLRFCFSQPSVLNVMPHNKIFFCIEGKSTFSMMNNVTSILLSNTVNSIFDLTTHRDCSAQTLDMSNPHKHANT